jgi:hypothetical protein
MRTGVLVACFVVVTLCVLLLLWAPHEKKNVSRPGMDTTENSESLGRPTQRSSEQIQPSQAAPRSASTVAASPVTSTPQSSNELYQRFMVEWQVPICFYGKVVDENSNAVPGASVRFHWSELPTEDGSRTATTESDAAGLFSLQGKRGPNLTVWVSKQGYYASHGGRQGFSYLSGPEKFSPDPQQPAVFELRRKGQGVKLITSQNGIQPDLTLSVPKDNNPIRVDFFEHKFGASGQLEVSQLKPPWREATEWSFSMSIPDGGLVEAREEFLVEAPETNYQATVHLHFAKGETNWCTHIKRNYYIVFGQPRHYGRIQVETDLSQQSVFLTYAINPTGSRDLEPETPIFH